MGSISEMTGWWLPFAHPSVSDTHASVDSWFVLKENLKWDFLRFSLLVDIFTLLRAPEPQRWSSSLNAQAQAGSGALFSVAESDGCCHQQQITNTNVWHSPHVLCNNISHEVIGLFAGRLWNFCCGCNNFDVSTHPDRNKRCLTCALSS